MKVLMTVEISLNVRVATNELKRNSAQKANGFHVPIAASSF
jgi:hypothetical protein